MCIYRVAGKKSYVFLSGKNSYGNSAGKNSYVFLPPQLFLRKKYTNHGKSDKITYRGRREMRVSLKLCAAARFPVGSFCSGNLLSVIVLLVTFPKYGETARQRHFSTSHFAGKNSYVSYEFVPATLYIEL